MCPPFATDLVLPVTEEMTWWNRSLQVHKRFYCSVEKGSQTKLSFWSHSVLNQFKHTEKQGEGGAGSGKSTLLDFRVSPCSPVLSLSATLAFPTVLTRTRVLNKGASADTGCLEPMHACSMAARLASGLLTIPGFTCCS